MSRTIPVPSEPLLTRTGQINPIWWRYLRGLESQDDASGVQGQIRDILRRLSEIPEAREIIGRMSVVVIDQPDGTRAVQLDGDSMTPGANAFYSTDQNGRRRWAPLSQSIKAGSGISFTDSGYTVMGAVDSTDDLPPAGDDGQAWWVGNVLYAWDAEEEEWAPDYSPSGELHLELIPGVSEGDTLVWDAEESQWGIGQPGGGDVDGGRADSIYTAAQRIDGGGA